MRTLSTLPLHHQEATQPAVRDDGRRGAHSNGGARARPQRPQQPLLPCAPAPQEPSAAGGQPSWVTDLDAYLANNAGPCAADPAARHALAAAVKASPNTPDAWLAFLSAEEAGGAGAGGLTGALTGGLGGGSGGQITLYHMYFWATQLVPRARHQQQEEYVKLWLGYARQQW